MCLVSHLGAGVDIEAQVVVAQLGGHFLEMPGEGDLPGEKSEMFKQIQYWLTSFYFQRINRSFSQKLKVYYLLH